MSELDVAQPILVLSSHLDDAVLSCGQFLYAHPSTTVVTVLAGAPDAIHEGYNSSTTGKRYAPDAIDVRRDEDRKALGLLGATPVWLDLLDADYSAQRPQEDFVTVIRAEIARVLEQTKPASIFAPLGLMHPDHVAVSDACFELTVNSTSTWYLYMDLPYGLASRRVLSRRLSTVTQRVHLMELSSYNSEPGIKEQAVNLYASQYAPTRKSFRKSFDATLRGEERYWRVETAR
jgi:LmbE family N-acetylglucosaminyl deacetylase